MAYSDKAKRLRRCKKVKADGSQCRAYARINGQFCPLHGYDHKTKKLPKKNEREAAKIRRANKRAQTQPHQTCDCLAYGWRHRAGSGVCKFPDPPEEKFVGGNVEPVPADEQVEWASSPRVEQDINHRQSERINDRQSRSISVIESGLTSRWERVIGDDDSTSAQNSEDDIPDLDSEQPPTDRDERERWNRAKLQRLIERESLIQREAANDHWSY
jgi:hypothetical protein